jgi:hypothetical protein
MCAMLRPAVALYMGCNPTVYFGDALEEWAHICGGANTVKSDRLLTVVVFISLSVLVAHQKLNLNREETCLN